MAKTRISIYINEENKLAVERQAQKEKRAVSNMYEIMADKYLAQVDNKELEDTNTSE